MGPEVVAQCNVFDALNATLNASTFALIAFLVGRRVNGGRSPNGPAPPSSS